jgi:hypothetical protein
MAGTDQDQPSGWVGMAIFAGTLLILVGGFNVIYGLVALFKDQVLVATASGLVAFNVTTWGWITLILGVIQIAVGFGILGAARVVHDHHCRRHPDHLRADGARA